MKLIPLYYSQPFDENQLFGAAIDAQDDGEDDVFIDLIKKCIEINRTCSDYHLRLVLALLKVGKIDQAKAAAKAAAEICNNGGLFLLEHARISDKLCEWDSSITERRELLDHYIDQDRSLAAQSLIEMIFPLCESNRYTDARHLIQENKHLIFERRTSPRPVLDAFLMLGYHDLILEYFNFFDHDSDTVIDAVNIRNTIKLCEAAIKNRRLINKLGPEFKLISLGQNCLPYTLISRWGLNPTVGIESDLTIFDLGAFPLNLSPELIQSNFSMLRNVDNYWFDTINFGVQMGRVKETAISFFHERGPFWVQDDKTVFFRLIDKKIRTFERHIQIPKKFMIFCICGEVDFDDLLAQLTCICETTSSAAMIINV